MQRVLERAEKNQRRIPTYEAQGSQISLKPSTLSKIMLEIFSLDIIQEIFRLANTKETDGDFQALVVVILAPKKMKNTSACVYLEILGIGLLSRAMVGS